MTARQVSPRPRPQPERLGPILRRVLADIGRRRTQQQRRDRENAREGVRR